MNQSSPNYKRIYLDILKLKFPEKQLECREILENQKLTIMDVIELNTIIFGPVKETYSQNQKFKCYNRESIFHILDYQKKHNLNNIQTARYFKMSRNTLAKWKKKFI